MRAALRRAASDLSRHRGEALFLVLVTLGIVASLLLATALFGYATDPWQRVFSTSNGAHVWLHTSMSADARALARIDGVEAIAGPYPSESAALRAHGAQASVELRSTTTLPSVSRPLLTSGHWLTTAHPDEVVLESSLAHALLADVGDRLTVLGTVHPLTVAGIADSAEPPYDADEGPGLVWALPSVVRHPNSQVVGVRLRSAQDTDYTVQRAVTALGADAVGEVSTWKQARAQAEGGDRLLGQVLGAFGLAALIAAGFAVHGAISTRIRGQMRDISVLKAMGFTPGQITQVFLLQHVAYALLGALAAAALTQALGSRMPGRLGDAVHLWQGLPGHAVVLLAIPLGTVLLIGVTTALAAWRAGRVAAVPMVWAAVPGSGRLSSLARGALGRRLPPAPFFGWRRAFSRRTRSATSVARLALPLLLIVVAMSAWTTLDRFQSGPERTALTLHADGGQSEGTIRSVLDREPRIAAVYPGVEMAALIPGQTATIALRGLGTRETPYPYPLAGGRPAHGPDEAVAGQGLLDLLHIQVGAWVRMTVEGKPQILHIVGRSIETENAGRVISTSFDTLRDNNPALRPSLYQVQLRPGEDERAVVAALTSESDHRWDVRVVTNPAEAPTELRGVVTGLIVILALIGLIELLTTIGCTLREGERDLLALKAIGLSPRQIVAITVTATGWTALAALLTSIALGLPLALCLINAQGNATGIGAGIAQAPPIGLLTLFGGTTVLGAAALAVLPAARAVRRPLRNAAGLA
ncbi:FtsX-like permease family protein [Streptomyces canus]|uniref:ABC transporter permease n=1 Tax=Streptomyces canus TaxID=58343 RepID=UPI0033F19DC8